MFSFPSKDAEKDLRCHWTKFVNRGETWVPDHTSVICRKHFENKYVKAGKKGVMFLKQLILFSQGRG